jgi:hypothetical protein
MASYQQQFQTEYSNDGVCTDANKLNTYSLVLLSTVVFASLFNADLLGLLLSSDHFRFFLEAEQSNFSQVNSLLIDEVLASEHEFVNFHASILKRYSGIFIAECTHANVDSLMLDLDEKCKTLVTSGSHIREPSALAVNHVEMAWKYRRACVNGNPVSF